MAEHLISIEEARANLLACAAYLAETIKSSDGHAEAMKTIVPFYLAKSDVDLAAEFANTVDDPFTRDRLLTAVAEKCAALDDDEYAFQLVEAIEDYGMQAQAQEKIVLQKSAKGDYEKALEIAGNLKHPDYALADIAVHLADKGDESAAFETLEKIEFPSAKVSALTSIAAAEIAKNELANAVANLEKAVAEAAEIEHSEEKLRALNEIGALFTEAKSGARAIETLDKAKSNGEKLDNVHRDNLLAVTSLGFLKAGSLDFADRTLDLVHDKTQTATALTGFAREFWEKGEKTDAVEALEEAYQILKSQHERETRDSRARYALFTTIAVQFAQFEKPDRALEIAQENADENQQVSALSQIAQILTVQGSDDLARQAIQAIAEDSSRLFALIGVSDAKNRAEKRDEAVAVLAESAQLAETVEQLSARSGAFNELARRFLEYGETERARAVSHENLETIAGIRDESIRVVTLANLAEIYEKGNFELTEAEKLVLETMIRKSEWLEKWIIDN